MGLELSYNQGGMHQKTVQPFSENLFSKKGWQTLLVVPAIYLLSVIRTSRTLPDLIGLGFQVNAHPGAVAEHSFLLFSVRSKQLMGNHLAGGDTLVKF